MRLVHQQERQGLMMRVSAFRLSATDASALFFLNLF